MNGTVTPYLEARIPLTLRGPRGTIQIAADIDTGFSEFLVVPASLLRSIGLGPEGEALATLGDGATVEFGTCRMEVEWFGRWRSVLAYIGEGDALVGMKLLEGHDLYIRVVPGGDVRVAPV